MRKKVYIGLGINAFLFVFLVMVVAVLKTSDSTYMRFGPSADFKIVSVHINTWGRYLGLMLILALVNAGQVYVDDLAGPVLGFSVFDPHRLHITEFSKTELNLLVNGMSTIAGLRGVLMILVSIAQVDVSVANVIFKEIVSLYTVNLLLSRKTFGPSENVADDDFVVVADQEVEMSPLYEEDDKDSP